MLHPVPAPHWIADRSRAPVVVLRVVGGGGRERPDFESFLLAAEQLLARAERVVIVQDLTHANPDAQRRKRLVEWTRANLGGLQRYMVAYAVVAPTAFHRGLIVATRWFIQPTQPFEVFATLDEALVWARSLAKETGLLLGTG
jgi:hypothetical protein